MHKCHPVLTVNFLSFDSQAEAEFILELLTSKPAQSCLDSMVFWDDKRPITIDILRRLSLQAVARELGLLEPYTDWAKAITQLPPFSLPSSDAILWKTLPPKQSV